MAPVDAHEVAVRVALEELGGELVELPRASDVAELGKEVCEERVASARVLDVGLGDHARDLHRHRRRLPGLARRRKRARLLETVLGLLHRSRVVEEGPPPLEQLERLLGPVAVELDVREELVGASRVRAVLGQLDDRERLPRVRGRPLGVVLLGVEARLEPVEPSAKDRVSHLLGELERAPEQLLRAGEVGRVDQRVPEEDAEARGLDPVAPALGLGQADVEDLDRGVEVAEHRVRAPERVREARVMAERAAHQLEGLLEERDRPGRVAAAEGQLAEPLERPGLGARFLRGLERFEEELLRDLEVVEAERELGLGQAVELRRPRAAPLREELRAHAEALAQLVQHLERGRAHAGLDPGDVGRRAAREGELALAHADPLPCLPQPFTNGERRIDVC